MKKTARVMLIVMWAGVLGACAGATQGSTGAAPQAGDDVINPGDRIGDFLITTGYSEDVVYATKLHCPFESYTNTESCEQPVGTKFNVGIGIYADNGTTLDETWSEQTHQMLIEGRPVNLQAFGSVDFTHPSVGTVRVWNVVVVTDKPGKITAHSSGTVGGDPFDYTVIVTFTTP